MLYIKKKK